jgi:agmatine deiminase
MNFWLRLLCALLLTTGIGHAAEGMDENPLPIGFTEEELTRLHEIGMDHVTTAPPTGAIRNSAEWERSQGVIVRYPFGISYDVIAEMSQDIMVTTIVASSSQQSTVEGWYTAYGVNLANCDFLIAQTNTYWTRDYCPWFIFEENGDMAIVDPIYNRPRPQDDVIPQALGAAWGLNVFGMPLATPGGNHMSDGLGRSMATVMTYNENSSFTQGEVDSIMQAYLGNEFTALGYTESGGIHHIDVWAKFLSPTVILVKAVSASHSSYALLNERADQLSQMTSAWGKPYTVVRAYCPSGAGYTNSIILNNKVLVPVVGNAYYDSVALATYSDAMPGYEVLPFTGSWLYDDALHCRAMGVPDSNMLWIVHVPLPNQSGNESPLVHRLAQTGVLYLRLFPGWHRSQLRPYH